ncbi:MAG: 1-acyl-sn-glycerol-3-phosphate acyltransferase [Leptospiraceae bacterium]|nr:1-acyl-sn-glycerol-3-phosphate acyltransferase [Leptospiraceae bacterium]MCP5497970.1 1-acyl-sn-glycerol-3-phosphate acyltransferase [Leptospiraceae bacterium]
MKHPIEYIAASLGNLSIEYKKLVFFTYLKAIGLAFSVALPVLFKGIYFAIIGNKDKKAYTFLKGSIIWGKSTQKRTKTNLVLSNEMNIPEKGHLIFLNHINEMDFPFDCIVVNKPYLANQVIKKSFLAYWWMKNMGSQVFDTSKAITIAVSVKNVLKGLSKNSFVVYPEGQNTYGEVIKPLKKGMIKLAFDNQIPIVVVLKTGVSGFQTNTKGNTIAYKNVGVVEPEKFKSWEELRDHLFELMTKEKTLLDASV